MIEINILHLLWIAPLFYFFGFAACYIQGETTQIGGKNNTITINGVKNDKN